LLILVEFKRAETNDLIYEGIATAMLNHRLLEPPLETNDLIYEGIATLQIISEMSSYTF